MTLLFRKLFILWNIIVSLVLCIMGRTFIIRHSTESSEMIYKSVLESVTHITSAAECAELCYNKTECRGSMLYSTTCLLYRKAHCPCSSVSESISRDLPSRYKILKAAVGQTWQDMSDTCQQQGMHLLAVNSQLEHDMIINKLITKYGKLDTYTSKQNTLST